MCLFTCIVTRGLHLEIVSDMSAEKFLLALRRFVSRRGKPEEIILDNASQFKVTKRVVDSAWDNVTHDEEVYNYVSMDGIRWKFITELSPWQGGFYERLVAMVKSCIRKSIGKVMLSKEQLHTFMTETEAVINSTPLVYVHDDVNSWNAITPGHFMNMITCTGIPTLSQKSNNDEDISNRKQCVGKTLIDGWKKGQRHLDVVWNSWN